MSILTRLAQIGSVDLRWLLTGQRSPARSAQGIALPPEAWAVLDRFNRGCRRRHGALAATVALLDLLEEAGKVEPKRNADRSGPGKHASSQTLVPVLGRTAAGVPQFWHPVDPTTSGAESQDGAGPAGAARPPVVRLPLDAGKPKRSRAVSLQSVERGLPAIRPGDARVRLVQHARPASFGELSVSEFLECAGPVAGLAGLFALRIDGDSMVPVLNPADLVILSPYHPARPGHVAVVQLRDQIGVSCKIYREGPRRISLIPLNERYRATTHALDAVVWALDVLYKVRLSI